MARFLYEYVMYDNLHKNIFLISYKESLQHSE